MDKKIIRELVDTLIVMIRKYNVSYEDNDYDSYHYFATLIDGFCFAFDSLSIDYHFKRRLLDEGIFVDSDFIVSVTVDGVAYDVD